VPPSAAITAVGASHAQRYAPMASRKATRQQRPLDVMAVGNGLTTTVPGRIRPLTPQPFPSWRRTDWRRCWAVARHQRRRRRCCPPLPIHHPPAPSYPQRFRQARFEQLPAARARSGRRPGPTTFAGRPETLGQATGPARPGTSASPQALRHRIFAPQDRSITGTPLRPGARAHTGWVAAEQGPPPPPAGGPGRRGWRVGPRLLHRAAHGG